MTPEEFAARGGNLPSTGSDERHNDTANDAPEEGPELRQTWGQVNSFVTAGFKRN